MQDRRRIFISGIVLEEMGFHRSASQYTKGDTRITYDGLMWLLYKEFEPSIKIQFLDEINV